MLSRLRFAPPSLDQPMLFDIWGAPPDSLWRGHRPRTRRSRLGTRPALASRGHLGLALPGCDVPKEQGQDALATKVSMPRTCCRAGTHDPRSRRGQALRRVWNCCPIMMRSRSWRRSLMLRGFHSVCIRRYCFRNATCGRTGCREFLGKRVTVAGFVATARRARTSDNRVMGFVTVEDATGLIEVSFLPGSTRPVQNDLLLRRPGLGQRPGHRASGFAVAGLHRLRPDRPTSLIPRLVRARY